jgi:hypothetical protein
VRHATRKPTRTNARSALTISRPASAQRAARAAATSAACPTARRSRRGRSGCTWAKSWRSVVTFPRSRCAAPWRRASWSTRRCSATSGSDSSGARSRHGRGAGQEG